MAKVQPSPLQKSDDSNLENVMPQQTKFTPMWDGAMTARMRAQVGNPRVKAYPYNKAQLLKRPGEW